MSKEEVSNIVQIASSYFWYRLPAWYQ